MQEVPLLYKSVEDQINKMEKFKMSEKNLDSFFGKLLAHLQGANNPENFQHCLTTMEFSMIFYYASLFQIISSKKTFLKSFLSQLSMEKKIAIINQLFYDLQGEVLIDEKILNIQENTLTQNGLKEAVKKYDMLMNNELDKIFKNQLSEKHMIKSKITSILGYAGLGIKEMIIELFEKGIQWIFLSLATALTVYIGFFALSVIVSSIILGLIGLLIALFVWALQKKVFNNPNLKFEFFEGLTKFIQMFKGKKIARLDFRTELNEYQSLKKKELDSTYEKKNIDFDNDRIRYFKSVFEHIIDFDQYLDDSYMFEVYNQLIE